MASALPSPLVAAGKAYLNATSDENKDASAFFYYPFPVDVEDLRAYLPGSAQNGHGSYSTVWLARDLNHGDRHVALKFLTAGARGDSELEILQWIRDHKHDHPFQHIDAARACFSLIRRMLHVDPGSRPSAEFICNDPWWEDGQGDGESSKRNI